MRTEYMKDFDARYSKARWALKEALAALNALEREVGGTCSWIELTDAELDAAKHDARADAIEAAALDLERSLMFAEANAPGGLGVPPQEQKWVDSIRRLKPKHER